MNRMHEYDNTVDLRNPPGEGPSTPPAPYRENFFVEIAKFAFIALAIVVPIRYFIAQPFIVEGASMHPTFSTGQYLIIDQLSYRFEKPERGEVIVFKYPKDESKYFIKRIIGLPGETLLIQGDKVIIKNDDHPDGMVLDEPYIKSNRDDYTTITLGAMEYFVMGDNRSASSDSRIWGPLKEDLIVGRPIVRLFPLSKIDLFPGAYSTQE
ncbi:MAG: signal peptidase I [bacterium]|nr:signal peptidase I [bacterium]